MHTIVINPNEKIIRAGSTESRRPLGASRRGAVILPLLTALLLALPVTRAQAQTEEERPQPQVQVPPADEKAEADREDSTDSTQQEGIASETPTADEKAPDEETPTDEETAPVDDPERSVAGEETAQEGAAVEGEAEAAGLAEAEATAVGPCDIRKGSDEAWMDQLRRKTFETVCESAAWFDGFFGNQRFDEEARRTNGRVGARVVYDEHEGIEFDGKLKVRVDFPNLDQRINAFLGREDEDKFVTGTEDRLDYLPTFFARESRQEWLVGLGYRPLSRDRSSLDFDAGIEIDSPIDPFVTARYRYYRLVGDDSLVRARQTVYWTNERGVGSGTRLDYERPVGTRSLVRLGGNVVFDDEADGADWDSGITLYHGFTPDAAISWFVGIDGETGREVPIEDYGTSVTYRQRMLREWFFGEVITGVTWPRDNLEQQRELAWHVGFGFEIFFSGKDLKAGLGRATGDRE